MVTVGSFVMIVVGLIIHGQGAKKWVNNVKINTHNTWSLLREVVRVKLGLDATKWDTIAARLNKIFKPTTTPPPRTFSTTVSNAPDSSRPGTLDH